MKNKIILISIIVLGILLGGLFLLSQKNIQTGEKEIIGEVATSTSNVSEKIDTSGWKTYRSDKYGFEIKYPDNFTGKEYFYEKNNNGFCDVFSAVDKEFSKTKQVQEILENKILSFQIYVNPNKKCNQRIISHYNSQLTGQLLSGVYIKSKNDSIGNKNFLKKQYKEVLPEQEYRITGMTSRKFSIWEITLNKNKYIFSYYYKDNNGNLDVENNFKKIISTFKSFK